MFLVLELLQVLLLLVRSHDESLFVESEGHVEVRIKVQIKKVLFQNNFEVVLDFFLTRGMEGRDIIFKKLDTLDGLNRYSP